jgi:ectoine hydroxylase-related dioxygenase (phytanoyl-CoA dioxygenase family)
MPEPDEILQAEMPAGSVLIYFGSLIHSGGANKTDKSRTGLVISYCLGWLKQAENQFLSTPIAIAKNLPERLQRLIGYFVHKPNLGCVEGQDPIKLLSDEDIISCGFEEFIPDSVKPIIAEYRENIAKAA